MCLYRTVALAFCVINYEYFLHGMYLACTLACDNDGTLNPTTCAALQDFMDMTVNITSKCAFLHYNSIIPLHLHHGHS